MNNPEPLSGRAESRWFSPRDWSLRVKLAVVLLVPALLAVVLGGLRIADQTAQASDLDRVARFAAGQGDVAELVEAVQEERYRSSAFVAESRRGDVGALQQTFAKVNALQEQLRPAIDRLESEDTGLAAANRQAEQALARLPQLRDLVVKSNAPASAAISRYSDLIAQLVELDVTLLRGVNTADINGLASGLAGLATARNEASLQLAMVSAAAADRKQSAALLSGLQSSDARLGKGLTDFRAGLDAAQRVRFGTLIAGAANGDRGRLVQELLAGGAQPLPGGTANRAAGVYGDFLAEVDAAESGVRNELVTTSAAARESTVNMAVLNVALLLASLLIGAIIVGLIARLMIGSLRTLRRSALEVAEKRLPDAVQRMRGGTVPDVNVEPVPVDTREEVGQVARAFDAVHAQAVRLAAEQATLQNTVNSMFVNLSRRSQSLVDRQLQLIEELESNEEDPDQLSSLFRLDHLATRMRRNSENLLVLAGTDLANRAAHHVPIVDVLQAAVSEVDQYERVVVEQPPALAVLGRAASDLQHLLSELLDNATSFSSPDTQVTMIASRTANGPVLVEINDRGVGMSSDELDDINRRFATADAAGITASRRMGLFVVGRLAARHGVQIYLEQGRFAHPETTQPGKGALTTAATPGLTARVTIPAHLVVSGPKVVPRTSDGAKAVAPPRQQGALPQSLAIPPQRTAGDRTRIPSVPEHAPGGQNGHSGSAPPRPPSSAPDKPADQGRPAAGPAVPVAGRNGPGPVASGVAGPGLAKPEQAGAGTDASATPGRTAPDPATPAAPTPAAASRPPLPERTAHDPARLDPARPDTARPDPARPDTARPDTARPDPARSDPFRQEPAGTRPGAGTWPGPRPSAVPEPPEPPKPVPASIAAPELFAPGPVSVDDGTMGRTPIFEEVASGWFRAYRQVPINWQPDLNGVVPDQVDHSRTSRPSSTPQAPPPVAPAQAGPPPDQSWPAPARPRPVPDEATFASAADDGWRAAFEMRRNARSETVQGTDLPRRTPGAQLLPGGIASAPSAPAASSAPGSPGAPPTRDADAIRSRLSNYQRGVRSGRTDRDRPAPDALATDPSSDVGPPPAPSSAPQAPKAAPAVPPPSGAGRPSRGPDTPNRPAHGPETPNRPAHGADTPNRPAHGADTPNRPVHGADTPNRPVHGADTPNRPVHGPDTPNRHAHGLRPDRAASGADRATSGPDRATSGPDRAASGAEQAGTAVEPARSPEVAAAGALPKRVPRPARAAAQRSVPASRTPPSRPADGNGDGTPPEASDERGP